MAKKNISDAWKFYIAVFGILVTIGAAQLVFQNQSITGFFKIQLAGEEQPRYLIRPSSPAAAAEAKSLVVVLHEFRDGSFSAQIPSAVADRIRQLGVVEEVQKLSIPQPKQIAQTGIRKSFKQRTCLPNTQLPWGVKKVNGGSGGNRIALAILDTGAAPHLDLRIAVCVDTTRNGVKSGCKDQNGHGTAVAGIAAAYGGADGLGIRGVAPDASLWIVKVCGANGMCWADDIAKGIYYATDNGANIISMSFGANSNIPLIADAISYAARHNVLLVAASGNDGPADGSIDWPAAHATVIATGALNQNDGIPDWSSRGINYDTTPYVVEERDIEFALPGVGIESTWKDGCYAILSGTSVAAPHTAGLAAKLWQGSASATRDYLQYLARYYYIDIGRPGDDPDAGFGLPRAQ